MRRFTILAAPLLATAWLLACEDDQSGGGGTIFLPDGSGGFDATPGFDANVPDASPDVVVTPQPVTVVVTNTAGALVPNITVVFHDANGAVIETKTTDAQGKAVSGISPIPAMATVAFAREGQDELLTWTGVQGGDVLPAVQPFGETTLAQVDITVPGPFLGDGGPTFNYYAKVGGCHNNTGGLEGAITVYLEPDCYTGAAAVLVAGSNDNDDIVAFSLKKPISPPTDGGTFAVSTEAWVAPPADVKLSVPNTTETYYGAVLSPIANGTAFIGDEIGLDLVENENVSRHTFKAPPGTFVDAYNAAITTGQSNRVQVLGKRIAPTADITFNPSDLPAEITEASVDSTTPDRPVANWSGNMSAMKGGVVRLWWFDGPNERQVRWSLVVPANAAATGSVKAPALPASLSGVVPAADAGSIWLEAPDVNFVDSDLIPDYGTWRKIQGVFFLPVFQNRGVQNTVLPQNGTFKITNYHPNFG